MDTLSWKASISRHPTGRRALQGRGLTSLSYGLLGHEQQSDRVTAGHARCSGDQCLWCDLDELLVQGLHEMQPHLCAIAGLASKLARSGEGCPVLVDKCLERRRSPNTNRFDQVVRAGDDPVLMVDGDLAQELDDARIARPAVWCLFKLAVQRSRVVSGRRLLPSGGHHLEHGLNAPLLVLDFFSEH